MSKKCEIRVVSELRTPLDVAALGDAIIRLVVKEQHAKRLKSVEPATEKTAAPDAGQSERKAA